MKIDRNLFVVLYIYKDKGDVKFEFSRKHTENSLYTVKYLDDITKRNKPGQWPSIRGKDKKKALGVISMKGGCYGGSGGGTYMNREVLINYLTWSLQGTGFEGIIDEIGSVVGVKAKSSVVVVRNEIVFSENIINKLFSGYEIIPQYPVFNGKYRIDWYIPELKLAIEYDEPHHKLSEDEDKIRQDEIEKELGCRFLRYKE